MSKKAEKPAALLRISMQVWNPEENGWDKQATALRITSDKWGERKKLIEGFIKEMKAWIKEKTG